MAEDDTWVSWIAAHRQRQAPASRHLLDACERGVRGVARGYPAVYFELGCRTEEAMTSLVHRVFADLDARVIGRFPFSDRTPFDSYLLEEMSDRESKYHSFSARLSVAREALRQQYSHNVRRHPVWLEREALHRQVLAALKEECATFPGRHPDYPRYGLRSWPDGMRPARADWDPEEMTRVLQRRGGWSVSARAQMVLARYGAPMYPGQISRLLQDASVDPHVFGSLDDAPATDGPSAERLAVRRATAAAFAELSPVERRLLALLLAGRPYREIPEELPSLGNATAITRALERICDRCLKQVIREVGGDLPDLRPKAAAELLLAVLVTVPEIRAELGDRGGSDS